MKQGVERVWRFPLFFIKHKLKDRKGKNNIINNYQRTPENTKAIKSMKDKDYYEYGNNCFVLDDATIGVWIAACIPGWRTQRTRPLFHIDLEWPDRWVLSYRKVSEPTLVTSLANTKVFGPEKKEKKRLILTEVREGLAWGGYNRGEIAGDRVQDMDTTAPVICALDGHQSLTPLWITYE